MKSTLRLFKALPVKSKKTKKSSKELLKKTISFGFVFSEEVVYNCSNYDQLIRMVKHEIGMSAEDMNKTFHKSWQKIKTANIEQLVMEQMIHYLTTYGFEALGIYNKDSVYIPNEKLELPDLIVDDLKLVVIKGYTKKELKENLLSMLQSGVALKEETIEDVIKVSTLVGISEGEIETVKNKEVKVVLYDRLDLIPENPIEFLRYMVYKATGKTLLIKNRETFEVIKEKKSLEILCIFRKYKKRYGLEGLAEIFYRFKPIFLAFRTNKQMRALVNKIRKLAVVYHRPMKEDFLNSITARIKHEQIIDRSRLAKELNKVNTFRKIRLAYALKFRTKKAKSILYRVRNGKGYATSFSFDAHNTAKRVLDLVLASIIKDVRKNVKGKKIYMPMHINYTLPATEKMFVDNYPSGTFIEISKDMVAGISWNNLSKRRVDLDLSLISVDGKIGWDGGYRAENKTILFSGDVTDAVNGATELFYVKRQANSSSIMQVNYYNYSDYKGEEVPFKIIVAKEQVKNLSRDYMVDPNNVITIAKCKMGKHQKILGLLVTTTKVCRFYFVGSNMGKSITSSQLDYVMHSKDYLYNFYRNTISLKDILEMSEAVIVRNKTKKFDLDLSPEAIDKNTILNLLVNKS